MGNFESQGYDSWPEYDPGDGWADASEADLENFTPVTDAAHDTGIIQPLEDSEYYSMRPDSQIQPAEGNVQKQRAGRQQPAARPALTQAAGQPPLRRRSNGMPRISGSGLLAASAALVAVTAFGTVAEAFGERELTTSEVKDDYMGTDFLGRPTDDGCLEGTPYDDSHVEVDGVLWPGQTQVTIDSTDPELPDLHFDSYNSDSGREIVPNDDYTDTFVRFHLCDPTD